MKVGGLLRLDEHPLGETPPDLVRPADPLDAPIKDRLPPGEVARAGLILIGLVLGVALLWQLREVLMLLFVAVLLATAIEPMVNRLRRGPFTQGSGTLVVYAAFVVVLGTVVYLAAPSVAAQTSALTEGLPERLQALRSQVAELPSALRQPASRLIDRAGQLATQPAAPTEPEQVVEIGAVATKAVIDFVTVFMVAFYWMVERNSIKRVVLKTVGPRRARGVNTVWLEVEEKWGGWFRGQLFLMVAIGVMAGVGYAVIGLPSPVLLAVFAALAELIPMVGPVLAFAPAVLIGLTVSPSTALAVLVYAVVIQQFESNVLVPRVMGHAVGVSSLTVVVGILVGAALYGLPGAFLAVPFAAAVQVVLAHLLQAEDPAQAAVHAELGEHAGDETPPTPNYDSQGGPGMVMLSELRRFELVDQRGGHARLLDVAVDMSAGDYPPVTRLFFRGPSGRQHELAWEALSAIDWERRKMTVPDLGAGRAAPDESLTDVVLLKRDVSDALVIDLAKRQAARANDLWLVEEGKTLWLRAVDVDAWAVARRLVRRRIGPPVGRALLDWRDVEFLRGDPQAAAAGRDYHRQIGRLPPGEIAHLTDAVPYLHAAELLTLLPDPIAADVFELMSLERQQQVLGELDEEQGVRIVALMAPDVAADLLGHLGPERAQALLDRMPPARAEPMLDLLRYPDDTAGGIMTNLVVTVPADLTIAEARRALKEKLKEPDFIYFVYAVDDDVARRLQGVITLRDLIVRDDDERVRDVMRPTIDALDALEPAHKAAARVTDSHLAGLPVVGRGGRLLGIVTVDAAVALIAPQAWSAQAPRVFS